MTRPPTKRLTANESWTPDDPNAVGDAYEVPVSTNGQHLGHFKPPPPPDQKSGQPIGDSPPISLGELLDRNPSLRKVAIDGLLRVGETMNLISQSKVGKSWGVLDLILAKATGRQWLGAFATAPGPVLLLDNELHRETMADRIRRVAAVRNIPLSDVRDCVHVKSLRGKLRDLTELKGLLEEWGVRAGDYSLTVMDAFYRFLPEGTDENSNAGMARVYNLVDELADKFDTAIALVHHSSKGDQSQKNVTDVGAGAGSMSRATDTHVILRPHEEESVCVMDVALRSFPPVPSRCFRWEFPVWAPADDLNPTLLSSPARKKQEQATQARIRKDGAVLLDRLDQYDPNRHGCGVNRLRKELGWGKEKADRIVAALFQDGTLEALTVSVQKGNGANTEAAGVRRRTRT